MAFLPRPAGEPMRLRLLALVSSLALAAEAASGDAGVTTIPGFADASRLAAPATGQTLFVLEPTARRIGAVDPFAPDKRWTAIDAAAFDADGPAVTPVAIACVDSSTLAVVCHAGAEWSLRSYRLSPAGGAAAPRLLQTLALGTAAGDATAIDVFVSDTRDWLAVVGLPEPLPPVVRAPIAGARLGSFAARLCPPRAASGGLAAATASPADEWVTFTRRAGERAAAARLAFHTNSGRHTLLDLEVDLADVRDAAFCRGTGTLWAAAGAGRDAPAGLWRIDAVLVDGRQAAAAVAIAPLESPLSVVCLSERAIAICGGGTSRRVLVVNPTEAPERRP